MDKKKPKPRPLSEVLMEQAMKYGRTATIKAADAIVSGPGAQPQMVHLELRPTEGGPGRMTIMPTHSNMGPDAGTLLGDDAWSSQFQRMGDELNELDKQKNG